MYEESKPNIEALKIKTERGLVVYKVNEFEIFLRVSDREGQYGITVFWEKNGEFHSKVQMVLNKPYTIFQSDVFLSEKKRVTVMC